jgi:hypothetical protein
MYRLNTTSWLALMTMLLLITMTVMLFAGPAEAHYSWLPASGS